MKKNFISLAVLGALSAMSATALAEDAPAAAAPAAAPASPHTFTYNVGLFSQYIFRGLTQTGERTALQGGVDYSHSSGIYLGTWASNISWLEDNGSYKHSSLELDLYGGYANTIGDTGIGYNVGLLQYYYPGDEQNGNGFVTANTTEVYGSLSYKWLTGKVSYVVSGNAFQVQDGQGTYYAELNANIPVADTGITANLHLGRQEFDGDTAGVDNDRFSYTDWKVGLTKTWSNGVNVGGYYTDTNAKESLWTDASNQYLGDKQFTVFVQKTF